MSRYRILCNGHPLMSDDGRSMMTFPSEPEAKRAAIKFYGRLDGRIQIMPYETVKVINKPKHKRVWKESQEHF